MLDTLHKSSCSNHCGRNRTEIFVRCWGEQNQNTGRRNEEEKTDNVAVRENESLLVVRQDASP